MRRREDELEAAGALLGEPVARLFRDVRRMIVEDQLDCGVRRVSRVQQLEKLCGRRRGRGILIAVEADGDAPWPSQVRAMAWASTWARVSLVLRASPHFVGFALG